VIQERRPAPDEPASTLLGALSGTFEPGNVDWIETKACRRCGAPTLRRPVFDTSGRIMVMGCVLCQYQNFEQIRVTVSPDLSALAIE
jgi:hypothetical protein